MSNVSQRETRKAHAEAQKAQTEMLSAYESHLRGLVPVDEFVKEAAAFIGVDYDSNPHSYRGNVVTAIPKEVSLKEAQNWWRRYYNIKVAIEQKAEWVQVLLGDTPLTEAEQLATAKQAFLEARETLRTAIAETGIPEIEFFDAASNEFIGTKRNRPYRTCMKPVERFDDWSVFNFTSWTESVKLLHVDLKNRADWVQKLIASEKPEEDETPAHLEGYPDETPLAKLDLDFDDFIGTLRCLIESLGDIKPRWGVVEEWKEDLADSYLNYKTVPSDREMVYLLLDHALSIMMERE